MHIRASVSVLMAAISNPSSCLSALARVTGVTPHKALCAVSHGLSQFNSPIHPIKGHLTKPLHQSPPSP